jgi:nitrogen fixation protein NifU and related proteins
MSDLNDLYQEMILDHSRHPHHYYPLPDATRQADGYNPLCGDQVTVYLKLDGERIKEVSFQGHGCAISKSSASVMTDLVEGKTFAEAQALFEKFHDMVTGATVGADPRVRPPSGSNSNFGQAQGPAPTDDVPEKMAVFSGVAEFPTRVKCAVLAWHTLKSALRDSKEKVKTE